MPDTVDLAQLVSERAYGPLEDAWAAAAEDAESVELGPLLEAADLLARQGEGGRAAMLLGLLAEPLQQSGRHADALEALRRAVAYADAPDAVREDLCACLRAVYGERPGFEAYLKQSGLEKARQPMREALAQLDDFLDFPVGRHVFHAAGWGVGRVVGVDARSGDLQVDFERKPGHSLPIESACRFVQRIPDESLAALAFSDLERLRALAEEDPAELIRLAVRSRDGEATSVQVKKDLVDKVVPAKQWSKLWTRAKRALTHDPHVQMEGAQRVTITLREHAVRFAEEVEQTVRSSKRLADAVKAVRQLLREVERDPEQVNDAERDAVVRLLAERLSAKEAELARDEPGVAIEAYQLLHDIGAGDQAPQGGALEALLRDLDRMAAVAPTIKDTPTLKRYVQGLREHHQGRHVDAFASALLTAPKEVFVLLYKALHEDAPEPLAQALGRLVGAPDPDAEALLEYAKGVFTGRLPAVPGAPDMQQVFERLIAFADRVERLRSGGARDVPNVRVRVRSLLDAGRHAVVRRYFEAADLGSARHTYQRIMSSHAITDDVREAARGVVVRRFPDVLAGPARHFWEDDAQVYTTQRGLTALTNDFEDVANRRIPENQKAIGEAAAHGDLSENAEYTAALEERDRLVARADRLRKELESARLLEEVELPDGVVGPGTHVVLEDTETGKREEYTILGPWDMDLEQRVISYTAPLAAGLLGRQVGDEAEISLPGGGTRQFRVLSIAAAI